MTETFTMTRRLTLGCLALALGTSLNVAHAAPPTLSDGVVRIGVLSDISSLYSHIGGMAAVEAVRMAAADFMKDNPDIKQKIDTELRLALGVVKAEAHPVEAAAPVPAVAGARSR